MAMISIRENIDLDFVEKEAYNRLRTNLLFVGDGMKVVGITSCIPGEGKSSVTVNLAVAMAELEKKVLFIDGDLRKSVLLGRYRLSKPVRGLTHYLSGQAEKNEIVHSADVKGLDFIFSGPVPPNPSELLEGEKFSSLISELSNEYEYIFIDTPPIGSVIDSAVISTVCDGMIMVIEANNISYKFAQKMKMQQEKSGTKVIGAILNKADTDKMGYYGKYYGKY